MRGLLSYDGALSRTLSKITDCMCLSVMWLICCIPLVTVGAATTALYYTVNKAVRYDRSGVWHSYWQSFRSNFRQATGIWLVLVLLYGVLVTSAICSYLLYMSGSISKSIWIILLVLLAVVTLWANYLFPYLARFNNATKQLMKNCGWIAVENFLWSILLLVISVAVVVGILLMPMGLFGLPAGGMLVSSYILERVFRKYMSTEDLALEDERNKVSEDPSECNEK